MGQNVRFLCWVYLLGSNCDYFGVILQNVIAKIYEIYDSASNV